MSEEKQNRPQAEKNKPVVVYIMILFIAAFLLMALSFLMHQRSNTEALGQLQNSVTAMQEVQATQEKNIELQEQLMDLQDELDKTPPPSDLGLMANYILYGKDENGLNAVQRGEIIAGNTRYNSYRRKDDKLLSLDAMLENPMTNQQELKPTNQRDVYRHIKPSIKRPKYDKKTGALIDIGDGYIPGMQELWDCIDEMEHWIAVLEGRLPPNEDDLLFDNSYRLYQLKHSLIDIRRHQYYLRDAYKPTLHFLDVDHPKHQYIDWTCDSYYWMTLDEWHRRVDKSLLHTISKNLNDYETRVNPHTGETEVKWMVR